MNPSQLDQLSTKLNDQSVNKILEWTFSEYGEDVGFMTALGSSGIVLLSHIRMFKPDIKPYFIDTGFHFQETHDLLIKLQEFWDLEFNIIKSPISEEDLKKYVGENAWENNPDLCCHFRKVDPLLRVLKLKKAWISALRRDQSRIRAKLNAIEIDGRGTTKIYPLIKWDYDKIWDYIKTNQLPYNKLHDQGYPSIGCFHCTAPVSNGHDERSGRWNSMLKLECGIHTNDKI